MKTMKKLLSIVMVLTLVLALGAQAFAVDIVIKDANATGSTYYYYRLMDVKSVGTKDSDGKDLFQYTINSKYREDIKAGLKAVGYDVDAVLAAAEDDDAALVELVSKITENEKVRKFAETIYSNHRLTDAEYKQTATGPETTLTAADGYYLITEETGTDGVVSLVILNTLIEGKYQQDMVTVTTKEDKPTSEKKVLDANDSEAAAIIPEAGNLNTLAWEDSADHDIGDTVYFQLKGTLPNDLMTHYETYELTFHDTEEAGLTFKPETLKVYLDDVLIENSTEHTYYTVKQPGDDGCTFDVFFENVKSLPGIKDKSVIKVVYGSELNTNANLGSLGNKNTMYMEYTNDSYNKGEGKPTGTTPKDTVIVFTYQMDTNKVNGANEPLEGAAFTLYKWNAETKDWDDHAMTMADSKTSFFFKGLDDGFYKLVETTVPAGYNKADDIYFTVTAEHDKEADAPALKSLTVTLTNADKEPLPADKQEGAFTVQMTASGEYSGHLANTIINRTGLELPSTGGIGTTIFYVAGAILVAGAVILLVTKRRVNGANK